MSYQKLLDELERAIAKRSPKLAVALRPGLSSETLRLRLEVVGGRTSPLVDIYSWHNGIDPEKAAVGGCRPTIEEVALAPRSVFILPEFDTALAHFQGWHHVAKFKPELHEAVERYFPLLWDGATTWLTLDLMNRSNDRVMLVTFESDQSIREVYPSFSAYLSDLIHANRTGETLKGF